MTKKPFPLSDHSDGHEFFNPGLPIKKTFKEVQRMLRERPHHIKWPRYMPLTATPQLPHRIPMNTSFITTINHASHLIQVDDLNILTDPVYAKRVGPASLLGPKRIAPPGIALAELPPIDIVLVSHNHYDHMDLTALSKIDRLYHPLFIVPLGNAVYLAKRKIRRIVELDWWQGFSFGLDQVITLTPAQHWSKRTLRDTNKALWGGYFLQMKNKSLYFAGDTGYGRLFTQIRENLGAPHVSILPIGSYEPRWFMQAMHLNPEEAVAAFRDLQSHLGIATHHKTFRLSYESYDDPTLRLLAELKNKSIDVDRFLIPENGETCIFDHPK